MPSSEAKHFKKILVPVDGSPVSKNVAAYAVYIALLSKGELVLMHVIEDVKQGGAIGLQAKYGNTMITESLYKARKQAAEKWISELADMAKSQGVKVKSEIKLGSGTSEKDVIVNYVRENDIDLIMMGMKSSSGLKHLLSGGATNAVIGLSPSPVLVVR